AVLEWQPDCWRLYADGEHGVDRCGRGQLQLRRIYLSRELHAQQTGAEGHGDRAIEFDVCVGIESGRGELRQCRLRRYRRDGGECEHGDTVLEWQPDCWRLYANGEPGGDRRGLGQLQLRRIYLSR